MVTSVAKRCTGVLLAVCLATTASARPAGQDVTVSAADLLEYYNLGEYDAVQTALTRAASGDLGIFLQGLRRDLAAWITADGIALASRRRLVVAALSLEVAHAGLETQWARSEQILEWACELLRTERKPPPAERIWHQAALALIEGARDIATLTIHVVHMKTRFPDEPRILMARVFEKETDYWNDLVTISGTADEGSPSIVFRSLDEARARPANEREADLRLGYLLLRAGKPRDASAVLSRVAPGDDPGQLHLAHLFRGWAYEALGQQDDAARSFRAALDAVPGAQTATLALAVRLYAAGQRDEADTLVDSMLAIHPPVVDPWRIYGYGDLRRWPMLRDALREELRAP